MQIRVNLRTSGTTRSDAKTTKTVSISSQSLRYSYEAQISYYTEHIKKNPEWTFVKVYTDEGISGLMTKKREGFQSMIKDALSGKIDPILTKSVSRFARNTVDTLTTVRKLKDKGIEVYFEKEYIKNGESPLFSRVFAVSLCLLSLICRLNLLKAASRYFTERGKCSCSVS